MAVDRYMFYKCLKLSSVVKCVSCLPLTSSAGFRLTVLWGHGNPSAPGL